MKKLLLSIFSLVLTSMLFAQDCTDLFFSEYVEGTANSKGIEIYNPTNQTIDLADYIVVRYSNGSATATDGYKTDLVGTIAPHDVFILVNGQTESTETSPRCDAELQALADQLDGEYPAPMYMNGNDAITLEKKNGIILDIFGKIGEDPGTGWCDIDTLNYITGSQYFWLAWSKDHTLIRKPSVKHGVFINPGAPGSTDNYFKVHVEWDTAPGKMLGDTVWESANVWDSLGFHTCDCNATSIDQIQKTNNFFLYPNPVTNQTTLIKATEIFNSVEIFNVIGQSVYREENDQERGDMRIVIPASIKGIHLVKVNFKDNSTAIRKVLIK